MPAFSRCLLVAALPAGASALGLEAARADAALSSLGKSRRQTPEELGFDEEGEEDEDVGKLRHDASHCLDLGGKGFPLKTFEMMQEVNWDPQLYFDSLEAKGYADDALQMTGPQDSVLPTDCMKENFRGKTKHIFVGDSQMMTLRNALHRRNKCPETWYTNHTKDATERMTHKLSHSKGRFHSAVEQAPNVMLPKGCTEEGIASYIFWDAWANPEFPIDELKREMDLSAVKPREGDTVVVWVGSNFITAKRRKGILDDTVDKLVMMGVKVVWDSPTFQDAAIMAAVSTHDAGRDPKTEIPVLYSKINSRKDKGALGSNEYKTEREFFESGLDIPMTKRWQLTNRYRGLQCDGIHTDIRGRDPLFYDTRCPAGQQPYGESVYCSWVEPMQKVLKCPTALGLDDLVLQSGLYSMCAAHEKPFCYQHGGEIR